MSIFRFLKRALLRPPQKELQKKRSIDTALNFPNAKLDQQEQAFVENIRQHGWTATHVAADLESARFTYSTGFWLNFRVPELVVFSLPSETAHTILWTFYRDLEAGKTFPSDAPLADILEGFDVILKNIPKKSISGYLGWNLWFYNGAEFHAQQIVFPDKSGFFPWDTDAASSFKELQPLLSESN